MRGVTRLTALALLLIPMACGRSRVPRDAELVFDVDFSSPEQVVGSDVKVTDPQKLEVWPQHQPSTIFFGHPTVVHDFCGLNNQPLRISTFTGTQNSEGVSFSLDPRWGRYHVELDLCVESVGTPTRADPRDSPLVVFIDLINAHAIGFNPDGKITALAPGEDPTKPPQQAQVIGSYELRKPMHLAVDVDLEKKTWRIALDGKVLLPDAPIFANVPGLVRVMARNSQNASLAIDNVLIWGQDDRFAGQEDEDSNADDTPDTPENEVTPK
ncbi:MAG TPA: hypothetical protein VMR50_02720 [Myxococcota bacterium]|nr:hypothetical protein [Myxococcota bacterium]